MPQQVSAHSVPQIKPDCGISSGNLLIPYLRADGVQVACPSEKRGHPPSTQPTPSTKEMVSEPWTIPPKLWRKADSSLNM